MTYDLCNMHIWKLNRVAQSECLTERSAGKQSDGNLFLTRAKTSLIENVRILYIDQFDRFTVTRVKGGQSFLDFVVLELKGGQTVFEYLLTRDHNLLCEI